MKVSKRGSLLTRSDEPGSIPFRLQERDLDGLEGLWRDRIWESSDFKNAFGSYYYSHRMPQLWRAGYIERNFPAQRIQRSLIEPGTGSIKIMHLLTNKGERALHESGRIAVCFRTYDATNREAVSIEHDLNVKRLAQAWRHEAARRDDVQLVEDEQTLNRPRVAKQHGRRFYEKEARDQDGDDYTISDKTIAFWFRQGSRRAGRQRRKVEIWKDRLCAIEWHTGSEDLTRKPSSKLERLGHKFNIYYAAARSLRFKQQYTSNNLTVLTVVEGGAEHLKNVTALAHLTTGGRSPNQFLAIQAPELMADPLGAQWLNAHGQRVSLRG